MKSLHVLLVALSFLVVGGALFAGGLLTGLRVDDVDQEDAQEFRSSEASNDTVRDSSSPSSANQKPTEFTATNNPLSNHDTYITFSDSPTSFTEGTLVAEGASVPDLLVCHTESEACQKGEFLIYFVDAQTLTEPNAEDISVVRSLDGGKTWSERQTITIENKPGSYPAVDPSLVQLSDGSLRMYFAFFNLGPGSDLSAEHDVLSAVSSDGLTFTVDEGTRLSKRQMTDPEVIFANDTWYMFYSLGPESGLAISSDGLTFEDQGKLAVDVGGVPGALAQSDGSIRVFGCTPEGIACAISSDATSFELDITSILPSDVRGVCDPSMQTYGDGFAFVYKLMEATP